MTRKTLSPFAALITLIGLTLVANAQPGHKVTATAYVPFDFVVGNRVFPAGTYAFDMATGSPKIADEAGVLVIRDRGRGVYAAIATGVTADSSITPGRDLLFAGRVVGCTSRASGPREVPPD